ncbi:MAG: cyclase family protein [Actinomycetota bacterium]|nr:cyclase family protein [Actinomycetota bacterium]
MSAENTTRARTRRSTTGLAAAAGAFLMGAGAVSAMGHFLFTADGPNASGAALACPGGISRLGHVLNEDASMFRGDPKTKIRVVATVSKYGYMVEKITIGSHTGTHLDAPAHFIENGRAVDELNADELVWPVYVIDVRGRMAELAAADDPVDFQLSVEDVAAALGLDPDPDPDPDPEAKEELQPNSIVVLVTGFEDDFGTEAYHNPIPGFSGAAVEYLFRQGATALGTDNLGPDASSDREYRATYTALFLDGVVVADLNNLVDDVTGRLTLRTGDLMIASPVALENGSAFLVDPLACHGNRSGDAN